MKSNQRKLASFLMSLTVLLIRQRASWNKVDECLFGGCQQVQGHRCHYCRFVSNGIGLFRSFSLSSVVQLWLFRNFRKNSLLDAFGFASSVSTLTDRILFTICANHRLQRNGYFVLDLDIVWRLARLHNTTSYGGWFILCRIFNQARNNYSLIEWLPDPLVRG